METTNTPAPGTILGDMPAYDFPPATDRVDMQPVENPSSDNSLDLARAKLSRLVECYAPLGVQSDAKTALASAIEEFEQAVRADEFAHVEDSAKAKAKALHEKHVQSDTTPPAPLDGELPPVSTADGTPLEVLPGAIPVVESENAPREIGDMPEAPKGEPILAEPPVVEPSTDGKKPKKK